MNHQVENPQAGQGQAMPKKEQDLFKSVVKHYETKQYKKGTKAADSILKKFPKHGETLCMKGLILNCTGKKEEAVSLVKMGLMNDMRSHVCWHVYGLLHRADRNYNEAIKAYKQALRIDPENLQILRDLSLLQIQMRDLSGFAVTRHTILTLKPNQKINWLSFALAKHLTGDLRGAISVIDIYLGTLDKDSPELGRGYESSELALYRNSLLAEIPDNWNEALEHLHVCKKVVVDELSWLKNKAYYHLQLQQYPEAQQTYLELLDRGSIEDYSVHSGHMCALLQLDPQTCDAALSLRGMGTVATLRPLTHEQKQTLLQTYQELALQANYSKSQAVQRIPLTLLEGQPLKIAIDQYARLRLSKGVPSLASDLSSLLLIETTPSAGTPNQKHKPTYLPATDPLDIQSHSIFRMLVDLADSYITSLTHDSTFPPPLDMDKDHPPTSTQHQQQQEPPSTLLWTWYFRALLHELAGEYKEALTYMDKCLEHTPTAVDVYELKARLLKTTGDIQSAANTLDKGRELDKQDRYINNQTTRYMLQADRPNDALERIALFTRHESDPEQNIFDMQCTWYELELAASFARKGLYGKSLKKYMAVEKHFEDFHEDQFDFHAYCIRKVTLRSYVQVLRWEDDLWGHSFYGSAAEEIIKNYLYLHDHPELRRLEDAAPDYSSMTAAERKKAKAQARKKKKAAEKKAADQLTKQQENDCNSSKGCKNDCKKGCSGGNSSATAPKDDDPNGDKFLKLDPLEEAKKYVATLVKNAPNRFSTWILQYDVAIRRGKIMMALQALFKAKAIDPDRSEVFTRIIDLAMKSSSSLAPNKNPAIQEVLESEKSTLLGMKSITDFLSNAAADARENKLTSLSNRIAIAKALISCKVGSTSDATSLITDNGINGRGVSLNVCEEALKFLKGFGEDGKEASERWISLVKDKFPYAKLD